MRMIRRIASTVAGTLEILTQGSWTYKLRTSSGATSVNWNLNIPFDPYRSTWRTQVPSINSEGVHIFSPGGDLFSNYRMTVANSREAIDISKFKGIRIKYNRWINCAINSGGTKYLSTIELVPASVTAHEPNRPNSIIITKSEDSVVPGEIFYAFTADDKALIASDPNRVLWVKASANANWNVPPQLYITSITLER